MASQVNKKVLKYLGDGKMVNANSLQIHTKYVSENCVELEVFVENKIGKFQLCNLILDTGCTVHIKTSKDLKIKSRVSIS